MGETVRLARARRAEVTNSFSLADYGEYLVSERDALLDALDISSAEYRAALSGDWLPGDHDTAETTEYGGRRELLEMVRVVVRVMKPETIVETGVAQGLTTSVILRAMEDNGRGHLHSIDLPVLKADEREYVGRLVPERLRLRWTLHLGPSRHELPRVLEEVGTIDIFLHDADHTYGSQLEEYRAAWPALRPGGVLLSDDVGNRAFLDFAREVAASNWLVGREVARTGVGLLVKKAKESTEGVLAG